MSQNILKRHHIRVRIVWGQVWVVVVCDKMGVLAEGAGALKAAALLFTVAGACHDVKLVSKFTFSRVPALVDSRFPLL